jgi:hypothetical protein
MGLHRTPVVDICRLCGKWTQLTFEHVPPRGAFNDFPRWYPDTQELLDHEVSGKPMSGRITDEPRGAGAYTLCQRCNNKCSRYAQHFISLTVAWREALDAQVGKLVSRTHRTWRARVMKQIMAMFLSANPPGFGQKNPDVRRYVSNAQEKGLPPSIRIHAALTRELDARQAGVTGYMNISGPSSTFSEIAFAPFVLMMTIDSAPPDPRFVDITFFAASGYGDRQETHLQLPVLELYSAITGTYK